MIPMYDFLNTITFLTVYWMCEAHLVNFAMKFKLGDWLFFRDFCNSSVCKWFDVLVLTILCSCMANWLSIAVVKLKVQINPIMFLFWGRVSSTIYAKCLKPCFRPIVPPCWQMQRKCKFPAFGQWHLLYRPMLRCHSWRTCFVYFPFA